MLCSRYGCYALVHAQKLNAILKKTLSFRLGHAQKLNAILKNLKSVGSSSPKIECYIKKPEVSG